MRGVIRRVVSLGAAVAILCCLSGCSTTGAKEEKMTLVKDGKAEAVIVLGEEPTKAAQFGAYELQHHIKLITGTELPIIRGNSTRGIRIYVGDSDGVKKMGIDCSKFGKQEYLIKFFPKAIVLAGKDKNDTGKFKYDYMKNKRAVGWPSIYDEIGTMHAVYDFLKKYCGIKWINPTDDGTIAPKQKTLVVSGVELKCKPNMLYRGGTIRPQTYNQNGGLWRNKTDQAKQYNKHAYRKIYDSIKDERQRSSTRTAQNLLFLYRMKAGGELTSCNHSFYDFYERFWKKKNDNFEAHKPEYFAKGYKGESPPQLCYSNPETVKQVVKDVRNYFDNGGYTKRMCGIAAPGYKWGENFFALEPMDNSAFCKCKDCVKQFELDRKKDKSQHSTYWFRFVNKVAKEIKKSHPNKGISTLAYMTHEGLPTGLKLEDNVVVFFCISGNRNPATSKDLLKAQLDRLKEWDQKEDVPMYLWLYHCFPKEIADNGKFYCFPGFFANELKRQFDLYDQLKIQGIFHCGFNGEVDNYVTLRLMDDPKLDVDQILDEYFSAYGKAGVPLKKMYQLIEERYCNPKYLPKRANGKTYQGHQTIGIAWEHLGNAKTMAKLQKYMDEAYKLAETDQEKNLVKLWDESVWSYMKAGRKAYTDRMSYPIPDITAPKVANANGDVNKVDWSKAAPIGDKWYKRGGKQPSKFKMTGKICHDGKYLYLELIDPVDPKKLKVSPQIACYDDWEIFIAGQRAQPFRQYMIGPTALTCGISYGEVNWRQGVKATEYTKKAFGMKADSNIKGDKWILRLCFPLKGILERPIKPGDDIYVNMMRVRNPQLAGEPRYGIDTWVAYTTVKDVDRLAKIHLE